jgi:hypothetical protein
MLGLGRAADLPVCAACFPLPPLPVSTASVPRRIAFLSAFPRQALTCCRPLFPSPRKAFRAVDTLLAGGQPSTPALDKAHARLPLPLFPSPRKAFRAVDTLLAGGQPSTPALVKALARLQSPLFPVPRQPFRAESPISLPALGREAYRKTFFWILRRRDLHTCEASGQGS